MPVDPQKLKHFAEGGGEQHFDMEHGEPGEGSPQDEAMDAPDNLSKEAMAHRLAEPHVGYMELAGKAGGLACGECKFFTEGAFCGNTSVLSYVSEKAGHCSLFHPADEDALVSPDQWEALSEMDEDKDEKEPEHDEGGEGEDEDEEEPEEDESSEPGLEA